MTANTNKIKTDLYYKLNNNPLCNYVKSFLKTQTHQNKSLDTVLKTQCYTVNTRATSRAATSDSFISCLPHKMLEHVKYCFPELCPLKCLKSFETTDIESNVCVHNSPNTFSFQS